MNINTLSEYRDQIGFEVPALGQYEFDLACKKVAHANPDFEGNVERQIRDEIIEHRAKFGGNANYLSAEAWAKVRADSEEAAKREVLAGNNLLVEVEGLERAANEAAEKARAKKADLDAKLAEARGLPARIEKLQARLESIAEQREFLTKAALETVFKETYGALLFCEHMAQVEGMNKNVERVSALLATRELRLAVLTEAAKDVSADLRQLTERKAALEKLF